MISLTSAKTPTAAIGKITNRLISITTSEKISVINMSDSNRDFISPRKENLHIKWGIRWVSNISDKGIHKIIMWLII